MSCLDGDKGAFHFVSVDLELRGDDVFGVRLRGDGNLEDSVSKGASLGDFGAGGVLVVDGRDSVHRNRREFGVRHHSVLDLLEGVVRHVEGELSSRRIQHGQCFANKHPVDNNIKLVCEQLFTHGTPRASRNPSKSPSALTIFHLPFCEAGAPSDEEDSRNLRLLQPFFLV